MGLDLVYPSGQAERSIRFTDAEWACIDRLRTVAQAMIDTLFNASEFGRAVRVPAEELAGAADAVLQLLHDRPDMQPATYQWRAGVYPAGTQPWGEGGGGARGGRGTDR